MNALLHNADVHGGGGEGGTNPPRLSELRVVEFSGKNQRIALEEYSRLVMRFVVLGQYLTQFWTGGGSKVKFREIGNFSILLRYISKTINRSDKPPPPCTGDG